jgi:hypothetical protein
LNSSRETDLAVRQINMAQTITNTTKEIK